MRKGLVQVYTGDGKGKTTAAIGLAVRAAGHGMRVCMVQFMKGDIEYGEVKAARGIPGFQICQFGRADFVDKEDPAQADIDLAAEGLEFARGAISGGEYDIVILDEINVAVEWGLVELGDVLELIRGKPGSVELVLTGRYARKEVVDAADLVTEMREVKHPFQGGLLARDGIEH